MAITISGSGITSANIADGTIVNADINSSAAIDGSKVSGSFGKVLQVANKVIDEETSTTTTSYVACGGTHIEFTSLASSASKVLIRFNLQLTSSTGANAGVRLYRSINGGAFSEVSGATSTRGTGGAYNNFLTNGYNPLDTHEQLDIPMVTGEYLDSPNTTSSVAYKIYIRSRQTTVTAYINRPDSYPQNDNMSPRGISSATLMEIGA